MIKFSGWWGENNFLHLESILHMNTIIYVLGEIISNMMTSSNGNIFRVTGPLCGKFTGPGEFPTQRPVTRSFDVFFDLRAFDSVDACKHDHYVYFFKESFHQASGPSIVTMSIHFHDDVIKWKHFRVTGHLCGEFTSDRWIPRTKASDAELWCLLWSAPGINDWVNNGDAGDLRRHRAHCDVIVM